MYQPEAVGAKPKIRAKRPAVATPEVISRICADAGLTPRAVAVVQAAPSPSLTQVAALAAILDALRGGPAPVAFRRIARRTRQLSGAWVPDAVLDTALGELVTGGWLRIVSEADPAQGRCRVWGVGESAKTVIRESGIPASGNRNRNRNRCEVP